MDRDLLEGYLRRGLSLEQIGALENKHASTIGYWVKKHGLIANGATKYAPRGALDREQLQRLVDEGLSLAQIAEAVDRSVATVRHWLTQYGIEPARAAGRRRRRLLDAARSGRRTAVRQCLRHGQIEFRLDHRGTWICSRCGSEKVTRRRRKMKEILVAEAGGRCGLCGYDRFVGALQFHHVDPAGKSFAIARGGITRGLGRAREEASKCALLCANCHAEVEAGVSELVLK